MDRKWISALSSAVLGLACATHAAAQGAYPTKPVRVLVGLAAGGGNDLVARILTPKLTEAFGQPFIVENRLGAGGNVAADVVAKSAPDGYMLLFSPNGPMVIAPTMFRKLPYSPTRDYAPVALAVTFPLIVSVHAALPIHSVKELLTYLKANPGKVNCGGSGAPFELAANLFASKTQTTCTFIQYKASTETSQAVMTGDLHYALIDPGPLLPALQGGKVRGIAVTTPERLSAFPDIPSVVEAGFPDLDIRFWMGLLAPTGTPAPIVKRLESEVLRIIKLPDVAAQLQNRQVEPVGMGSEEFGKFIASEITRWDGVNIPTAD